MSERIWVRIWLYSSKSYHRVFSHSPINGKLHGLAYVKWNFFGEQWKGNK